MRAKSNQPRATTVHPSRPGTPWRAVLTTLLAILLFHGATRAEPSGTEDDIRLIRDLLGRAETDSPAALAARARQDAARERIPQARALPDPTIGYGWFLQRMNTRQIFRVEQPLPGFGKREARGGVAEEGARASAEAAAAVGADIRLRLLENLAEWVSARQSRLLVEENITLVGKLEQVALRRYRTGESSQADVLRLQMEKETLEVERQAWREREPVALAAIQSLLGRADGEPLTAPAALPLPSFDPETRLAESAGTADNPDLRRTQSLVRQAERGRDLARREARPDFGIGVEYMDNRGHAQDEVMAMVTVRIPLWPSRYRGLRREASANLRAARQDHEGTARALESGVSRARHELLDARRRVSLYENALLPRARQSLSLLESDYRTGRSGFLDLLEAQRTLLELELSLTRARADYFTRLAWWERLTGQTLLLENES